MCRRKHRAACPRGHEDTGSRRTRGHGSRVRVQHRFDVPVERLFRAWSNPADLPRWAWASLARETRAEVDFRVGGSFRIETKRPNGETWSFSGTYTEIEPSHRIAHTLVWNA